MGKYYDLVVCGGGPSGLAAAVAAGRQGLKVAIVEEDPEIGGAPVDCYIQFFTGLPNAGIHREMRERMSALAPEMSGSNCFRRGSYLLVFYEMLGELDVDIITGRRIDRVGFSDGAISSVGGEGFSVEGKIFIDATGNGDIAALAGCEYRYGREAADEYGEDFAPAKADRRVQMCTQMFALKRFDDGTAPANFAKYNKDEYLIWGPSAECADTTDPFEVMKTRRELMAKLPEIAREWYAKGFQVTDIAPKLGVRESRRIVGLYTLKYSDVMERRRFDDSVTIAHYVIDPWEPEGNPFHDKEKRKRCQVPYYEIPYRCLVGEKYRNLYFVGRCISTTHVVNSSNRVIPICMMTGQAAGTAAKFALESGDCRSIDIPALQAELRRGGMLVTLDEEPKA